LNYCKLAIKK